MEHQLPPLPYPTNALEPVPEEIRAAVRNNGGGQAYLISTAH
ncbi:hypothetical protein [Brevibacillus reuszeri]|nr:hypothetical protein [Brevibacillus reuszeri]